MHEEDELPRSLPVFWITAVVIPTSGILAVTYATFWRRRGRTGATRRAFVFGIVFVLACLANPLLNYLIFFPLYGGGVSKMLRGLRQEEFVGKSKAELVSRFGRPDKVTPGNGYDEELYFDCRPWFYVSYPDAVVVRITEGRVVNFAYYH